MNTLIQAMGTTQGIILVSAILLAAAFGIYWLSRVYKRKQEQRRAQEQKEADLQQLSKLEKTAEAFYKSGKFQLAEANFRSAAVKAGQLGDQYRQWRNQHHTFIAMSKTDSGRSVAALQGLQKLVAELTIKLPAKDSLLILATQNVGKIEKSGLTDSAEQDFQQATEFYEAGKFDRAKGLYQNAYRAAQHAKNPILCALVLNDCSRIFARSNNFEEAIKYLDKASKIAKANCPAGHELPGNIAWNMDYYRALQKEQSVKDLLTKTRNAFNARNYDEALELANESVELASKTLKMDHWLTAEALHHRACIKMGQGFYSEARNDFDLALAILTEWPEQGAKLIELAETNLEKCRRDMGY